MVKYCSTSCGTCTSMSKGCLRISTARDCGKVWTVLRWIMNLDHGRRRHVRWKLFSMMSGLVPFPELEQGRLTINSNDTTIVSLRLEKKNLVLTLISKFTTVQLLNFIGQLNDYNYTTSVWRDTNCLGF